MPDTRTAIVSDTGGTNTRVALAEDGKLLPDTIKRFTNKGNDGLGAILSRFLDEAGDVEVDAACATVAGPVRDGRGKLTNFDWEITEDILADATGASLCEVLNDLQAQAHALGHISTDKLREVVPGKDAGERATQLVVGVGTGFNMAPVFHYAGGRIVPPSEAGHTNLPIKTEEELKLARFLEGGKDGFASVEEVLSGRGLEQVYAWCGSDDGSGATADAETIMACLEDGSDARAERAVALFVKLLGRVSGNLALDILPFGGLYFSGGVARSVSRYFERFDFAGAFRDKGRFSEVVEEIPVRVIEDDYAALAGCAAHLERIAG